ncbi:MAG: flippase-like domain-containing protein, partial [Thermodesulfobacteriota bacterium]|nr:flippase-like domain-containing protein [Thermodesulfobacteriota bacterium]
HPKHDDPAYGLVQAVKTETRDGKKILLAKFKNVEPEFAEMVKSGRFPKRSAGFYPDGRLRHVGFLGATPPAIKGLKNIAFGDGDNAIAFEFAGPGSRLCEFEGWTVTYFQLYLICLAFSIKVEFMYVLAVAPLFSLARLFPFTLNGLGTQEAVIIYLFRLINVGSTLSVLISLTNRVMNFIIPAIVGIIVIHCGKSKIGFIEQNARNHGSLELSQ